MQVFQCSGKCGGGRREAHEGLSHVELFQGEDVGGQARRVVEYLVPVVDVVLPKGGQA